MQHKLDLKKISLQKDFSTWEILNKGGMRNKLELYEDKLRCLTRVNKLKAGKTSQHVTIYLNKWLIDLLNINADTRFTVLYSPDGNFWLYKKSNVGHKVSCENKIMNATPRIQLTTRSLIGLKDDTIFLPFEIIDDNSFLIDI